MTKYTNLQILRILACFGVFLTHLSGQLGLTGTVEKVMEFGGRGPYLFFILSGFLAFSSRDLEAPDRKRGLLCYYIKRVFKIVPLYYAAVIINLIIYQFILNSVPPDSSGLGWIRYFLFLSTSIPADRNFWVNMSSTWTISIFLLFYLLAPLFKRWVNSYRKALLLWAALYVFQFFALGKMIYGMPFLCLHYFAMGIVLYQGLKENKHMQMAVGAVCFALMSLAVNGSMTHTACSMLFFVLIINTMELRVKGPKAQKALDVLDAYSYPVYLVHGVVMDAIEWLRAARPVSFWMVLLLAAAGTFVGCVAARYLIERPMEKAASRLTKKIYLDKTA